MIQLKIIYFGNEIRDHVLKEFDKKFGHLDLDENQVIEDARDELENLINDTNISRTY